jgi:hypothetical protein
LCASRTTGSPLQPLLRRADIESVGEMTQRSPAVSPRASDADRDAAVAILNNAVAIGELKPDEHEQRLQAALDATTIESLRHLTEDLTVPGNHTPWWSRQWRPLAAAAAILAAAVTTVALLSHGAPKHLTGDSHRSLTTATSSSTVPSATPSSIVPSASGVLPSPASAPVNGVEIQVVPPGGFADHDPADECGAFGGAYPGGGANCYLVVQFTNTESSPVSFAPVDLRMVDQTGDTYSVGPVAPPCFDTIDVNAKATLDAHGHIMVQLCYAVMTGALPNSLQGTRSLDGLSLTVPSDSYVGTWGGA